MSDTGSYPREQEPPSGSSRGLRPDGGHVMTTPPFQPFAEAMSDLGLTVHDTDKAALLAWLDSDECKAWEAQDDDL